MIDCSGMTELVPGASPVGMGDIFSSIFSFIPDTLKGAGSIAGSVPGIAAAFGDKNAIAYVKQQASIECTKSGGQWTGSECDMTEVLAQRRVDAQRRAEIDKLKAWAPWVGLGVGGIALSFVAFKKVTRKAS